MTEPAVLRAVGLWKSFGGVQAVRGASFEVRAGEMLAIIGPNGAGKSTCFNMVGGQVRPDRGSVLLGGGVLGTASPAAVWSRGAGRTFQVAATFGSMTVRENVQLALHSAAGRALRPWGRMRDGFAAEAEALLAEVGLSGPAEQGAGTLAYGDGKRLELALALSNRPRLLLMDEPTAGMAGAERAALMALVRRLATERRMAVLFTEHDPALVFRHADRVLVMDRGAVIAEGPPDAVRADPVVRAAYLGTEDGA